MSELTETIIQQSPEIQDLEGRLKQLFLQMELHAKQGKYTQAENCRVNAEKLRKQIESKRVTEVQQRHKKENRDVKKYLKEQMVTFGQHWQDKISSFTTEGAQMVTALKEKQKKERDQTRTRLQEELPEKWKESSECLNLRCIEENLAKQHNYVEAQKVQKLVREMEKKEQEAWLKAREDKIQAALQQLIQKQEVELKALEKRVETGKNQLQVERNKAETQLVLKQSNVNREIQSQNKKEFLSTKGEFKSRVDVLSPTRSRLLSPTHSQLLSPNSRSKLLLGSTR